MDGCHHVRIHARVKQFKNLSVTLNLLWILFLDQEIMNGVFFIVLKRILLM